MNNLRRRLPPLDSLLFFEAAARHGSFTRAAGELYVTQAAVSKRIQGLEDWIGRRLFHRVGRKLALTEEGQQLQQASATALDYLDGAIALLSSRDQETLRVAAQSSVAMFWLMPRLQAFGLQAEAAPINLITSEQDEELLKADQDLVLMYLTAPPRGWQGVALLPEVLAPVAAPSLAERHDLSPERPLLASLSTDPPPLLNYTRLTPDWTNWEVWAKRLKLTGLSSWPQAQCLSYAHSIGEALRGQGVALGSLSLIAETLQTGRLVPVSSDRLECEQAFWLLHKDSRALSRPASLLFDFLVAEAEV